MIENINYPIYYMSPMGLINKVDKVYINDETAKVEKILVHDSFLNYEFLEGERLDKFYLLSVMPSRPNCVKCYDLINLFYLDDWSVEFVQEELFEWGINEVYNGTKILDINTFLTRVKENYIDNVEEADIDFDEIFEDRKRCIWID